MNERKFKGDVRDLQGESLVTEYMTEKKWWMNEKKNERKKERKEGEIWEREEKNMSMRKVNSPVL
jgi:hypothetical protein